MSTELVRPLVTGVAAGSSDGSDVVRVYAELSLDDPVGRPRRLRPGLGTCIDLPG